MDNIPGFEKKEAAMDEYVALPPKVFLTLPKGVSIVSKATVPIITGSIMYLRN